MATKEQEIQRLLSNPELLLMKKPFTRGAEMKGRRGALGKVDVAQKTTAVLPQYSKIVVPQEQFAMELDPNCHNVLFDDNIPSICVKLTNGAYREIKFQKLAVPIQRVIKDKQLLHLTGNKMQFTLIDTEPTERTQFLYTTYKQYWDLRNQDGMKTKIVDTQLSYGDAGLLYYFDYNGRCKSRLISFADGYVLCPHDDQNGDRILESVYYQSNGVQYIDSFDDTYMYRYKCDGGSWVLEQPVAHGFSEIPLITKRGAVAWDNVQPLIESYEALYNVFMAIQKRFGWGVFYVKGKFRDDGKKLAGNIVLNDTSIDGKGDAKFLTPPTPDGMIETLKKMLDSIQLGSKTTFVLPDDIKTSGDISGLAVQLTRELDILNANQAVIEWQNVADKMVRLFKEGLAKELVASGDERFATAITDFAEMDISAKFKVWRPFNEYEYNQMITMLTGANLLSRQSGIELNTLSKPDEKKRLSIEAEEGEETVVEPQNQVAQ